MLRPDDPHALRGLSDEGDPTGVPLGPDDVVLLTTFFISRDDPQLASRADGVVVRPDDYEYMAAWYESVLRCRLRAVILHDELSPAFVERYRTPEVRFLRCRLGPYSLNDERFLLYLEFLRRQRIAAAFATDISDVVVTRDPAGLLELPARLFVGRDRWDKIRCSEWVQSKLRCASRSLPVTRTERFGEQPLYNAGILGGRYDDLVLFLERLSDVLCEFDNAENNNTIALNAVLHEHYTPRDAVFKPYTGQTRTNPADDPDAAILPILSGFPVCSEYKAYQSDSAATFIHK